MRILATVVLTALIAASAATLARRAPPVQACTPGPPFGLETAARADMVVLAEAVRVGSAVNSAPTVAPGVPPTVEPASPPFDVPPTAAKTYSFDLSGYGATLHVLKTYSGPHVSTLEVGSTARAFMERAMREIEAYRGPPVIFSDCPLEWNTHRYVLGARYLVIYGTYGVAAVDVDYAVRYRVSGNDVLIQQYASSTPLWYMESMAMGESLYRRYFAGVPASLEGGLAIIAAERVPLTNVLRAIAEIRGDPSIAPPDTGSAGLAARR